MGQLGTIPHDDIWPSPSQASRVTESLIRVLTGGDRDAALTVINTAARW